MPLTRRQFLAMTGGSATAAVLFAACGVPEKELLVQASFEMPEDLVSGSDSWYATLCRQCATSDGVVIRVMEGRAKKVEGNIDYPLNQGRHSARCEAGLQALYHPDRIQGPLLRVGERGTSQFQEISWTDAIGRLTFQLQELQRRRAQRSMVFVTNPVGGHLGLVVERFVDRFRGRFMPYEPIERTNLRAAIKQVFGDSAKRVAISSTKSSIGHLLGASGGVELAATIMGMINGVAPPTINLETPCETCDLDYIPNTPRDLRIRVAMSNSFGFGGHNACVVLKQFE